MTRRISEKIRETTGSREVKNRSQWKKAGAVQGQVCNLSTEKKKLRTTDSQAVTA